MTAPKPHKCHIGVGWCSSRSFRVKYDNNLSSFHTSSCGVPQSSVLGPLLFIMYAILSVLWSFPFPLTSTFIIWHSVLLFSSTQLWLKHFSLSKRSSTDLFERTYYSVSICAISTGCASQSGYGFASVFWRSAVSTVQLRPASLTVFAGCWRRGPPSPALVSHSNSDCPACQAINPGRPIILCRRSTGMEQSAVNHTGCIVAHHLPTRTESISFSLEFSGPLVANSLFPPILCRYLIDCVKCSCCVLCNSVT